MSGFGLTGQIAEFVHSYLTGRTQRVKINGVHSEEAAVTYGVPQGSVLGPLLFLLYINDLYAQDIDGKIIGYADDTCLIVTAKNNKHLSEKANLAMKTVYHWLCSNSLVLNVSKTKVIRFSWSTVSEQNELTLKLHKIGCNHSQCSCSFIEQVKHIKYLGITIDERLSWRQHISKLMNKLRFATMMIYKLKYVASQKLLRVVYFAFFQSLLQYCLPGCAFGDALQYVAEKMRTNNC